MAADSPATLQYQIDCLRDSLCQPETEDSWNKIARAIESLSTLCVENSEEYHSVVTSSVRSLSRPITSAMVSERTRLSGTAVDFVGSIATSLERNFESLAPVFIPSLLLLCSRANKVFVNRAKACLSIIIEMTQLASLLPYFVQAVKDKSATLRLAAAEAGLACLNSCNPQDLEKESRIRDMESMIRSTAKDASADVRKVGKKLFQAFQALMPDRVPAFAAPLSPTMRKYLELPAGPVHKQSQPNLRTLVKSKSHAHLSSSTSALSRSTSPTLSSVGQRPVPERPASSMSRAPPVPSHGISRLRNEMGPPALPHTRSQPSHPTRPMSTLSRSASAMERPKSVIMPSVKAMREPVGLSSSDFPAAVPRPRVAGAIRVRPESIHGMPSTAMSTIMARRVPAPESEAPEKEKHHPFVPKRPMSAVDPAMASTSTVRSMDNGPRNKAPPPPVLGKGKEKEAPKPMPKITAKLTTSARAVSVTAKDRASAASKPSVSRQASATIQPGSRFAPSRSASSSHAPSVKSSSPAEEEVAAFPTTDAETAPPAEDKPTHKVTASLTIAKGKHAPRTGGLSQPTQAQLARMRPPVERKVTAPAAVKPGWGRSEAPPPRQRTVSTMARPPPEGARPPPRQRVVSMRAQAPTKAPTLARKASASSLKVEAAKIPLPPSPRPAEKKNRVSPAPAPVEEESEEAAAPPVAAEAEHLSQVVEEEPDVAPEDVFVEKKVESPVEEKPAETKEESEPSTEEATASPIHPPTETVEQPAQELPTEEAPKPAEVPEATNDDEEEDEEDAQEATPRKASTVPTAGIAFQTTAATPPMPLSGGPAPGYNNPTYANSAPGYANPPPGHANPATPARAGLNITTNPGELEKTPISQLLMSIERGFHWTPEPPSPLSPSEAYRDVPVMSGVFGQPIPIHLKKEPEARYDA